MCKIGRKPISSSVKTVPIIQTTATARTSFSRLRSSSSGCTSNCGEIPITAAAPQIPVPQAVKIANCFSTPNRFAKL